MKMKLFGVFVLTAMFTATPVVANLGNKLENKQQRLEERIEIRKERAEEKAGVMQARKEEREENRSERLERHAVRLEARFTIYYDRLSKIIGRVQTRINGTTGKDTGLAQTKLEEARTKLSEAKTLADSAVSQFKAIGPESWEEQKVAAKTASETATKARLAFVEVIKLINDSVKLLKSAANK